MSNTMKADVKAAWLEALRSGNYKQGTAALNVENRFCCLGVLCDLAAKAGGVGEWTKDGTFVDLEPAYPVVNSDEADPDEVDPDENDVLLTYGVAKWSGLTRPGVDFEDDVYVLELNTSLAGLNDAGKSFAEIADVIEKHIQGV